MASEERNLNFKLRNGDPLDAWEGPYETDAAAIAAVPVEARVNGRTVKIGTAATGYVEKWWKDGTADNQLVVKQSGGGGGSTPVDSTYNPESANPPSGMALAPVIDGLAEDVGAVAETAETADSKATTANTEVLAVKNRLTATETTLNEVVLSLDTSPLTLSLAGNTAVWSVAQGRNRSITLPNASVTVTMSNFADGSEASLLVKQGATTGGFSAILQMQDMTVKYIGDRNTPAAAVNAESLFIIRRRGSVMYVEIKVLFEEAGTPPPPPPTEEEIDLTTTLVGYATQNGGTTGGAGGSTVTVSNFADLVSHCNGSTAAKIIKVSGTITCTDYVRVKANKTIIGLSGATINGGGFFLDNDTNGSENIIIQNIKFNPTANSDGITIRDGVTNVWVDHCEVNLAGAYDGGFDATNGSSYITYSWCKLYGADKGMLMNTVDFPSTVQRVTIHHCYFLNVFDRAPACFYGNYHVFNCYYLRTGTTAMDYQIGAREGSFVRAERNYFKDIRDGYPISDLGTNGKVAALATNIFSNCNANRVDNQDESFSPSYSYSSVLNTALEVPDLVSAGAGATLGNTATGDPNGSGSGSGGSSGGGSSTDYGLNPVCIGWAAQHPSGAPTGGQGGPTVTVSNFADFKSHAEDGTAKIIKVNGTISSGTTGTFVQINSNKTIIGNTGATLVGCSLRIDGTSGSNSWKENVIIQNIHIKDVTVQGNNADGLRLYMARRIWVDHCTFTNTTGDGAFDIGTRSDWTTISYCKFNGYIDKTNLIGGDDAATSDRTYLNTTIHHCYFYNCQQRCPRVRFGKVHVFNNYYKWDRSGNNTYAVWAAIESTVKIENNYFEDIYDTINVSADCTAWENDGNTFDGSGAAAPSAGAPSPSEITMPYTYTTQLQSASAARTEVLKASGGAGNTLIRS